MKVLDILDLVEKAKGKEKQAILAANKDNAELQQLLDAALNFSRKFHIKKFNKTLLERGMFLGNFNIFMKLLESLETKQITGNMAVETVEQFFNRCDEQEAKWYSRVLCKDLQAGFSISTAIKAGFKIPKFDVMLAKDGKKCKKLDSILKKGCSISPKLDGYRCLAIVENESVSLHTRNGDVYKNFPVIEEALKFACNSTGNYVFDGEIMSDNFNKMQQSAFAAKRGTTVGDVKYHIFDMIPYDEWIADNFKTVASERYETLSTWFKGVTTDLLVPVSRDVVTSLSEVLAAERSYINAGYEGAMVNPDIPYYKGKKSNKMMKFKTMLSMDCEIIGFYEGEKGKRLEGTLGGIVVKQENNVSCEVGTGFSDADRQYIWENQSKFLERVIEIRYQSLTEKEKRMLFPSAIRWRIDKD